MVRRVLDLPDDGFGIGFERTGNHNESNKSKITLQSFTLHLSHLPKQIGKERYLLLCRSNPVFQRVIPGNQSITRNGTSALRRGGHPCTTPSSSRRKAFLAQSSGDGPENTYASPSPPKARLAAKKFNTKPLRLLQGKSRPRFMKGETRRIDQRCTGIQSWEHNAEAAIFPEDSDRKNNALNSSFGRPHPERVPSPLPCSHRLRFL